MDFDFDHAVESVKEAFGNVAKTTEKAVNVSKKRIDIVSAENRLSKNYENLGRVYFEFLSKGSTDHTVLDEAVEAVREGVKALDEAQAEFAKAKNQRVCPACGASIENGSKYCNHCGAQVVFEEE